MRLPRLGIGSLFGILAAALIGVVTLIDRDLFGLEWLIHDRMTRRVARRAEPDRRIVIVAINEEAIKVLSEFGYGRPQAYPRELMARAVAALRAGGARIVAFDIIFSEENPADPEGDRMFAEALSTVPSVLAADALPLRFGSASPRSDLIEKSWRISGATLPVFTITPPHPMFSTASSFGSIRLAERKESAAIRRYLIGDAIGGGRMIPSLALATAAADRRLERRGSFESNRFTLGPLSIPLADASSFYIRWHGARRYVVVLKNGVSYYVRRPPSYATPTVALELDHGGSVRVQLAEVDRARSGYRTATREIVYPQVGFHQLIAASFALEDPDAAGQPIEKTTRDLQTLFRGKIVLVGSTAAGLHDLRATPIGGDMPGVQIHANALDNLINNEFNRPLSRVATFLPMLALAALSGALMFQMRSPVAAAAVALGVVALTASAEWLLLDRGYVVRGGATMLSVLLTYVAVTVVRYLREQQQTLQLKRTFGRYVSPQILEHILLHPELVELGGERRDLTILFSDIRGFTSISEATEPEDVVEMLNEYLTRMVEILLRHGGTLDKFIGDAVMGFWNAPTPDDNHPEHAVACAIEMIEETARLRQQWEGEGKPALRIGIGINTGEAVVGNIGSAQVFGYTVIGDAVNLASRLEGKNKDYGTEIIISEFTRNRVGDTFVTAYLDEVQVKGKARAVKIYEVKERSA